MQSILDDIRSGRVKKVILDTDTYNEVDDQFALAYAMLSPERIELLSVNAAPFLNDRSTSPLDGMEKSYQEIFKIMHLVDPDSKIPVYRGSVDYLVSKDEYQPSDACDNIVNAVMSSDEPIYIVAIGAITNVASAIIKCPEVARRAVLVWLGGTALHLPSAREFNLMQDVKAAQVVFDSGIRMVQVPCEGVCTEFHTTLPELEHYLRGNNQLCDYLIDIVATYVPNTFAWSKVIWDVTAVAALVCPGGEIMNLRPRPILTDDQRWDTSDDTRAPYVYVSKIWRDPIYADLFLKLARK